MASYDSRKDGPGNKKSLLIGEPELEIKVSEHARGYQEVADSITANATNGIPSAMCNSEKMQNKSLDCQVSQWSSLFMKNSQPTSRLEKFMKSKIGSSSVANAVYFGSFQSNRGHSEAAKLNKSHNGCNTLPTLALSIHDVETMRICTSIDSLEEASRGPPKIAKTTHHFLITKKTDINLSEKAQMLRESTVTAKLKEKHLHDLFKVSTDFSIHNQKKTKLMQSFGSSANIEEGGNIKHTDTSAVCPSNESSAETETMDLDPLQENYLAGPAWPPSNKDLEMNRKAQSHDATSSTGKFGDEHLNPDLPDLNKELPDFPVQKSSKNIRKMNTSRTQSLGVESLLSHAQQLKNKCTPPPDGSFRKDLCNRWCTRLRCSASNSEYGNKNSQEGGATSGEKVNHFNETIKCSKSSSEPTMDASYVIKKKTYDERKNQKMLFSQPWIQRWCSNRVAVYEKKLQPVGDCKPECSKMTLTEFQRKEFPSIAAMGLMGKAMNGFRPFELTKKGSYFVWNTEGF